MAPTFTTIDDYIDSFPPDVQDVLHEIRRTMHGVVPGADETISYNIPTITLDHRPLIYFAGWKRHVSVYPIPDGDETYKYAAVAVPFGCHTARFPLAKPIPYDLIALITTLQRDQRNR